MEATSHGSASHVPVSTIGGRMIATVRGSVTLRLLSRQTDGSVELQTLVLQCLSIETPQEKVMQPKWPHLKGFELADPEFSKPQGIEILLGADVYGLVLLDGLRRGGRNDPIAQKTIFGWTVSGPTAYLQKQEPWSSLTSLTVSRVDSLDDLSNILQGFWNQSSCSITLGESLDTSQRILKSTLLRMEKDPALSAEYNRFMEKYERLGHMRPVPSSSSVQPNYISYYIPHHAIWQNADGKPKLRVVFNASRPTTTGLSVNQLVHTGPKLQNSLATILMRWRLLRVVFSTDIEMMYRQVLVDERDVDLQRILWKRPGENFITHFKLLTLTYGMSCSLYLAHRTLRQLALDGEAHHPQAARLLRENTYVDDILGGAEVELTAGGHCDQLRSLMSTAGLHLKKWVSNQASLLDGIPKCDRLRPHWRHFETGGPANALGVALDPVHDEFHFQPPSIDHATKATKRTVLSAIARLFDPIGWLSQIIIIANVLMQDLWRAKLEWDESLPEALLQRWLAFKDTLSSVANIRCSRWLGNQSHHLYEIHGFGDASKTAYAATVFIRIQGADRVVSHLLTAKSRVAPVKTLTIPRLELCATVLMTRLLKSVIDELGLSHCPIYAWSDSQIVLHWINDSDPSRWPTFIANRVSEVQRTLPEAVWRHVPTIDNPADVASQGVTSTTLADINLWWTGPDWLALSKDMWPPVVNTNDLQKDSVGDEITATRSLTALLQTCAVLFERFSTLTRLTRVIARCLRWKLLLKPPVERLASFQQCLHPKELLRAFLCCVYWTQQCHFSEELRILRAGEMLPRRGPVTNLHPFIDAEGVIRVGGRLANSTLPYDQKHPVILPGHSVLADLIIDWAHKSVLHGGFQLSYSCAMRRAWIIRGTVRVKAHLRNCVVCARTRTNRASQLMGQLPAERITAARPFMKTGVDYAGPFSLKATKGRGYRTAKGYIALFVCLCTKAIHLEVVGDLTTASFLAALHRFIGLRGAPSELWSDNATTFHGADAELRSMLKEAEINWTSILRNLTYEEMTTLDIQIEMCMNSRPLIPLVGDPEDLDILTPGHALIGGPLAALSEPLDLDAISDRDVYWCLIKKVRDNFWIHWARDYVHTLQQRSKWTRQRTNLQPGDLVMIADCSLIKTNRWPLGRITDVYPGPDGLVRTAKVRTSFGTYDRPIHKLFLLPVTTNVENST